MLPKNRRINKSEFSFVFDKGLSFHSNNLILKTLKQEKGDFSRFAVSFVKKPKFLAVQRNLLKRRIFSVIEDKIKKGEINEGLFFIFLAKKTAFDLKYKDLEEEISFLLKNFNLKEVIK